MPERKWCEQIAKKNASDVLCIVLTLPERDSYHPASIVRNLRSQWARATAIEDEPDHIRTAFRIRTGTEERARGIELDFSDSEPAPVLKASAKTDC